jgi:hypothetical protein
MKLWNPRLPIDELALPSDKLKRRLFGDEFRTVGRLESCPDEQLEALKYGVLSIKHIRTALREHRECVDGIADILKAEGITLKMLPNMQPFDLLNLPMTAAQVGYLLRWQRDMGGRYSEKDIYCDVGGRVYYCTNCKYRDERSNFCGFCTKKLLDDIAEKRRGAKS